MVRRFRILVVDDELIIRESLLAWLKKDGHEVDAAEDGHRALEMLSVKEYDLAFLDVRMPGIGGLEVLTRFKADYPHMIVVMITAYGSVETAVEAMKYGAGDYLMKPFEPEQLKLLVQRLLNHKELIEENAILRSRIDKGTYFEDFISSSKSMQHLFTLIEEVAAVDSPVLVQGETGTGKELVAKAIHAKSSRRFGPFIPINCGAFSEPLLESELFGHEKGSFTGAVRTRKGRLEMASGGTLFLDEIGEIPPKMQVDLLRVLQEKRFQRVGGNHDISTDFRLISATHRDLQKQIKQGGFRQDLYFRLNVIAISVPPLRERKEDIPVLAGHFLDRLSRETNRTVTAIDDDALILLQTYEWPGNVRELENAMERAVVLAKSPALGKKDFSFLFNAADRESTPLSLEEMERHHIEHILKWCQSNISKAAKLLEVNRTTLHNKINKYGLKNDE